MNATEILVPHGTVEIVLSEEHDPRQFFQTDSQLRASNDFRSQIVAKARKSPKGTSFKVNVSTLAQDATDAEIKAGLLTPYLFNETTACAVIAELIKRQSNGRKGTLLIYTDSCTIHFYWGFHPRKWFVETWDRDDSGWSAGDQVVSLATS